MLFNVVDNYLLDLLRLKMEATHPSETLIAIYRATRRQIQEERILMS